ncbi:MAG: hypothetical protein WD060_11965 [Pirellulales bacterium]
MSDDGDQLATRGTERRSVYRRRLAAAAVASVALHMILARGLAVSHLGSPLPTPADAAGKEPLVPKRKPADFTLQVSPSQQRPAHERPLDLAASTPGKRLADRKPEKPRRDDPAPHPPEAAEPAETPRVAVAELPTNRPTNTENEAVAPARQATAEASNAAAPAADTAAVDAARSAAPAAALQAATLAARSEPPAAPVASRWRPREVELLERLASRPVAPSRMNRAPADDIPDTPDTPVATRRPTTDTRSPTATADTIAAPAVAEARAAASVPAAIAASRRTTASRSAAASAGSAAPETVEQPLRATTSLAAPARTTRSGGEAVVAAARPSVSTSAATAAVSTAGVAVAPAAAISSAGPSASPVATASRAGRPTVGLPDRAAAAAARSGSAAADATTPAGDSATAAAAAGSGWVASRSSPMNGGRGRARGDDSATATSPGRTSATASAGGSGQADTTLTRGSATDSGVVGGGRDGGGGSDAGLSAARPGPAAIGRLGGAARGAGGAAGQSALGSSRSGGVGSGAGDDGEDEGLSVSMADTGSVVSGAGRRRGASDDPGLPQRIAAAALPAEGRVRDVAEAFAQRTAGASGAARTEKVADREVAQRAKVVVDRGLEFLARSQQADGRWRLGVFSGATPADVPKLESDTAATGLALLSFMGAGHDHFDGRYRDTVRRGLEFLLAIQKPDGDLFLPADDLSNSCAWLYSHGIASIAICEAVGMTGDPLVKPAAEQACRFIATSQHPQLGGWRYTPRSDADLSVSGWMLVAVRAGDLAGVKTDPATLPGVRRLLEAAAARDDATRYAYNPRKQDQRRSRLSTACMTAVGGLMRLHTGDRSGDPRVAAAARVLAAIEPSYGSAAEKARDSYLWYYASQVLVHTGGAEWNRWYGQLVEVLADNQELSGPKAGSWDPLLPVPDRWGEYGGRVYVTTLHLLALEVPDRHLPTSSAPAP